MVAGARTLGRASYKHAEKPGGGEFGGAERAEPEAGAPRDDDPLDRVDFRPGSGARLQFRW